MTSRADGPVHQFGKKANNSDNLWVVPLGRQLRRLLFYNLYTGVELSFLYFSFEGIDLSFLCVLFEGIDYSFLFVFFSTASASDSDR